MKSKGFTLVEVIVVLVILAILAAILVPSMTGWMDKAKEKRLLLDCRACVMAAQTLATEAYGASGSASIPEEDAVKTLAGVQGSVSAIAVDKAMAVIDTLTYDDGEDSMTYTRLQDPHYTRGAGGAPVAPVTAAWEGGAQYASGDKVNINGIIFECVQDHTAGNTKRDGNPTMYRTMDTWQVVGFDANTPNNYSYWYRYAVGVEVVSNGHRYRRKDYIQNSSPTPTKDSKYWELIS